MSELHGKPDVAGEGCTDWAPLRCKVGEVVVLVIVDMIDESSFM
jgi:hypothetical protein